MYGLTEIESMNRDAMRKAKRLGAEPFLITSQGMIDDMPPFPFPNIGGLKPKGWVKVNEFFVDSSGMGGDNEPALSVRQFKEKLRVGFGYAIVEEGQFQVYIGEFKKVKR